MARTKNENLQANAGVAEAVAKVGSTYDLARACQVVQSAVMHWLHRGCPAERAVQIEQVTGVSRAKIRPDIFSDDENR